MIPIKKNKFSISNERIIIETGLQIRMVVILLSSFFALFPFFLFLVFSINLLEGLILFKAYFVFVLIGFVLCWFLTDSKIIFCADSKTIVKKIWFIKKYTINFNSVENIEPVSYDNFLIYYGIVLKKDPLGKHKAVSPKYSQTKFDQKQLEEFDQKVLPEIKKMINPKID